MKNEEINWAEEIKGSEVFLEDTNKEEVELPWNRGGKYIEGTKTEENFSLLFIFTITIHLIIKWHFFFHVLLPEDFIEEEKKKELRMKWGLTRTKVFLWRGSLIKIRQFNFLYFFSFYYNMERRMGRGVRETNFEPKWRFAKRIRLKLD